MDTKHEKQMKGNRKLGEKTERRRERRRKTKGGQKSEHVVPFCAKAPGGRIINAFRYTIM
jgi:hypothetical protein